MGLIAHERSLGVDGIPWLRRARRPTLLSTLYAGTRWSGCPRSTTRRHARGVALRRGRTGFLQSRVRPLLGRYHEVDASLPYFLPFPRVGTLGAIIRMRGQMPDRKTLFDIGVAGPLAGLVRLSS